MLIDLQYDYTSSLSGYSNTNRRKAKGAEKSEAWLRRAAYDFHQCPAHADVSYTMADGRITVDRVIGFFGHTEGCRAGLMTRFPSVPLHEHVYEVALTQLAQGARYFSHHIFCNLFTPNLA